MGDDGDDSKPSREDVGVSGDLGTCNSKPDDVGVRAPLVTIAEVLVCWRNFCIACREGGVFNLKPGGCASSTPPDSCLDRGRLLCCGGVFGDVLIDDS